MQLGTLIPFGDIGGDPAVLREYAQAAEAVGYDFIEAPDHVLGQLRRLTEQAGRDPKQIGIEVWVSMGSGNEADWAKEAHFWKQQGGATHLCLTTTFNRRHHKRISGKTLSDHIGALRRFHAAIADAL